MRTRVVNRVPFAGWKINVVVTDRGQIVMDRFGSTIKPAEAEALGTALIKAAGVAKEKRIQNRERDGERVPA